MQIYQLTVHSQYLKFLTSLKMILIQSYYFFALDIYLSVY